MKAGIFHARRDVRYGDVPDPSITSADQMIVEIEATSICGSDLFLYDGPFDALMAPGRSVTGHEFVGRVTDVGSGVTRFRRGDRVTAPFSVSCRHCFMCMAGQTAFCETTAGAVYGFGLLSGDLPGTHAEAILLHRADENAVLVPDDVAAPDALTLSCNLPTAVIGVAAAGLAAGETLAIVGCGPTGLMTLDVALLARPARVVVLDRVAHRLAIAARKGAIAIDVEQDGWQDRAMAEVSGRGFDRVIEVVGSADSMNTALSLARSGGTVSAIGVFAAQEMTINPSALVLRNITLRSNGAANVAAAIADALTLIRTSDVSPREYFSHQFPLSGIASAYSMFSDRRDGAVKMLVST